MRDAVLRAADLGPDYEEGESRDAPLVMDESIMNFIERQVTEEFISILFNPASHGTPRQAAIGATYWAWNPKNPDRPDIGEDDPPPFGDESVSFRWHHEGNDETKRNGHIAAWRYGDVIVTLIVQGRGDPTVMGYALRQHEKLRAAFPTPPLFEFDDDEVDPILKIECPKSHPIRGVQLEDGTRIYLLPMDAAYNDATPVRCFNSDLAAERAGYHRRPDETPGWETSGSR
jgi:hypothetical protein